MSMTGATGSDLAALKKVFGNNGFKVKKKRRSKRNKKRIQSRTQRDSNKARKPIAQTDTCVYIIGSVEHRVVKIGYATDAYKRIKSIQTSCPFELYVFKIFANKDMKFEKELHERFKKYRTKGEWFRLEGHLLDYLKDTEPLLPEFFFFNPSGYHIHPTPLSCLLIEEQNK